MLPHLLSHPDGPGLLGPQSKSHVELSPPHTLHSSTTLPLPQISSHPTICPISRHCCLEQSLIDVAFPPHTPQTSNVLLLPHLLSHPDGAGLLGPHPKSHVELSPPHLPHSSTTLPLPQISSHPTTLSILRHCSFVHSLIDVASPPHTPHTSNSLLLPHSSSQPDGPGLLGPQPLSHVVLSPPQTPQSSN